MNGIRTAWAGNLPILQRVGWATRLPMLSIEKNPEIFVAIGLGQGYIVVTILK
jgi:hypothetical protein